MESGKEVTFFDNNNELNFKESTLFLKNYFLKEMPEFNYESEYYHSTGHWGIFFENKPVKIFIGYDRSFIDYSLIIDEKEIYLPEFDRRISILEITSKKNFIFLISIIKKFLESVKD
jgi:hypothetical protein